MTSEFTKAEQALFLTYATGVKARFESLCPIQYQEINDTKTQITVTNAGTLFESIDSKEACYWVVESELKKGYYIEGESEMTIVLETAQSAEVYILQGSDRATAESMIEQGDRLYPGNPLRIGH